MELMAQAAKKPVLELRTDHCNAYTLHCGIAELGINQISLYCRVVLNMEFVGSNLT